MNDHRRSREAFAKAKKVMPGGVNSPVRAYRSVDGDPIFIEKGKGAKVVDLDGNEYIDYVLSWGPLICGHANERVVEAVQQTAAKGLSFGAPHEYETRLAELLIERVPSLEVVRMVNSGTEATMSALRLARGHTGKSKIVKFAGCYHGHGDSLLIQAGSGVATLGLPDSPGVPQSVARETITVPYNDIAGVETAFERYGEEIAAVIVEPVAGNMGVVPPQGSFLKRLRELTLQHSTLLIFDEVMTGFRVDYYSAQGFYGIEPDLTCLGKVIGGGLPVGAYGGKKEIMQKVAPEGPVYQAGTLSGNPLAMASGYETIIQLEKETYRDFHRRAKKLAEGLSKAAQLYDIPHTVNRAGSMIGLFFTEGPVVDYASARRSDLTLFRRFFHEMLSSGVLLPPSQFEGLFLSTAHDDEIIDETIDRAKKAFAKMTENE